VGDRRGGDRHCDHALLAFALNFPEQTFPDVGRLCVLVPLCTENRLRFSATLGQEPRVEVVRLQAWGE
jgi:hypothetical protein